MSFELTGVSLPDELTEMAIGPWATDQPRDNIAFDRVGSEQVPVWRVDLDSDPASALAELDRGLASIARTEAELAHLPGRLGRAIELAGDQAAGLTSFDPVSPEARLLADLSVFRSPDAGGGPISFDVSGPTPGEGRIAALTARVASAIESVIRMITHAAWVETRIRGRLVMRTAMRWSGDAWSEISDGATAELAGLHSRSVSLAVRSRGAWTRLISLVLQAAARIARAAASSNPITWAQALPALWEYTRGVLAEIRTIGALGEESRAITSLFFR